jgi:hypothetical protein
VIQNKRAAQQVAMLENEAQVALKCRSRDVVGRGDRRIAP